MIFASVAHTPGLRSLLAASCLLFAAVAVDASYAQAPELSESDRKALEALQGIWTPVSVDFDESDKDFLTITIEGDRMAWPPNPGDQVLIDTAQKPPRVDFVSGKPGQLGYLANIFQVDGDELLLCRSPATKIPRDVSRVQGPGPKRFHPSEGQVVRFRKVEPLPNPMAVVGFDLKGADDAHVSFDGSDRAAITIGQVVIYWDLGTNRIVDRWTDPEGRPVSDALFLPDGKRLAISFRTSESATEIWDLQTKRRLSVLTGSGSLVSSEGESLLTWDTDGTLRAFDLQPLRLRSESVPSDPLSAIAFHPDGSAFAISTASGLLMAFDRAGELSAKLPFQSNVGPRGRVIDLAYDPRGEQVFTLEYDGQRNRRFAVRNARTLEPKREFEFHDLPHSFAFAPDGKSLYVGASYGTINQVDARDGDLLRTYRPFDREEVSLDAIRMIRVSPDGSYLAATSGNVCCLWDLRETNEASNRETIHWPPLSPGIIAKEIERTEGFHALPFAAEFVKSNVIGELTTAEASLVERPANLVDAAGKPTLSWRIRLLDPAGKKFVESAMRVGEPWDTEWNRRAIPLGADVFGWSGVEKGKTTWQLATGPTTAYDGSKDPLDVESAGCKIFLIETAADRAVVWSEPRDYAFDPQNPRAGLPKDGFHFIDWEGSSKYVRGDIPDDLLRRMFSAEGTIAPGELLPYTDAYLQRLYR